MPEIPVYQNPDNDLKSNPEAASAYAQAGRRVGAEIRQTGEAIGRGVGSFAEPVRELVEQREKLLGHQEIGKGMADWETAKESLHDQYDKERAGVTDPNQITAIQGKYLDALNDASDKWLGGFKTELGRNWAATAAGEHKGEFLKQIRADNAEFAAAATKNNVENAVNAMGGAVLKNPSILDHQLSMVDHNIDALYDALPDGASPKLLAEKDSLKQAAKEHIVKQAVEGVIQKGGDPNSVMSKYGSFIKNPAELQERFENHTRGALTDQLRQKELERMQRQEKSEQVSKRAWASVQIDPVTGVENFPPDFGKFLADPNNGLSAAETEQLGRAYRGSILGIRAERQENTATEAMGRAYLPDEDGQKLTVPEINELAASRQINASQRSELMNALAMPESDKALIRDTEKWLEQKLGPNAQEFKDPNDPNSGVRSTQNLDALANAKMALNKAVREAKARNQSLAEILGDRASPNYLFRDLSKFNQAPSPIGERATTDQGQIHHAVGLLSAITRLSKEDGGLDTIQELIKTDPLAKAAGIDVHKDGWCATALNFVLNKMGMKGTGSELASSFKNWGFAVDPRQVKEGDVFVAPPSDGFTGHVGMATGNVRQGPGGQLQIEVVSSHLQGDPKNEGGVEWRNAAGLEFRRFRPTIQQAYEKPSTMLGYWQTLQQQPGAPAAGGF